jgi:hypothetical protein
LYNLTDEDDTSESEDQSSSSDEATVTRSNVIDIVEDYEGLTVRASSIMR